MYSTEAKIRQEAGFQNNTNVTATVVTNYQTAAYHKVNGYVAKRYSIANLAGTPFTNSQASIVLEECERLIAAGSLLMDQYAGQQMGEQGGKEKLDRAQKMLDDIAAGTLKLIDVNNNVFTADVPISGGLSMSYTAPAREDDDPTSSERKFSVDTKW